MLHLPTVVGYFPHSLRRKLSTVTKTFQDAILTSLSDVQEIQILCDTDEYSRMADTSKAAILERLLDLLPR